MSNVFVLETSAAALGSTVSFFFSLPPHALNSTDNDKAKVDFVNNNFILCSFNYLLSINTYLRQIYK
ncbi:hypothetical protein GCM10022291_02360 [Postechiella marina]|uniref:Uncharacterized protein n=1 Tax=Postechiella marina TaxID=943941 RepID=A0ABP8BZG0_9FLAO